MTVTSERIIIARDEIEILVRLFVVDWRAAGATQQEINGMLLTLAGQVAGWLLAGVAMHGLGSETFVARAAPELVRQIVGNALAVIEGESEPVTGTRQ